MAAADFWVSEIGFEDGVNVEVELG